MYHQHVIYSCDLVDTQQTMACRATISKIWQRDGALEYDILFAEPSDGDDGRFGVPEDKLDADPAARGAVNQPPAATHVPFAGDGERIAVDAPTSRQHKMGMERWLQAQEKRVKETAEQFQERKRRREEEKKEEERRQQRRAVDAAAKQAAAAPAARQVTEPVAAAPV